MNGKRVLVGLFIMGIILLVACTFQPTPTSSQPLSKPEDLVVKYNKEMRPMIEKLQTAQRRPAGFQMPEVTQCQIIMVPMSERLFYIQEILFPKLQLGKPDASVKLYITYDYKRGVTLNEAFVVSTFSAHTQSVRSEVRLIAEVDGKFYLVEEKEGEGGSGCSSYKDLVSKSVEKLDSLGNISEKLESILETIIGYATGLDWDRLLDFNRRLAVLIRAFDSEHWADRKQAAETLRRIGPEEGVVPALIKALLRDESQYVRKAAAEVLGKIGPEAKEAVPALIKALKDKIEDVRKAVALALNAITGQDFGEDASRWQEWWEGQK